MAGENPNEEQSKSVNFNNNDEQSYDNTGSRRLSCENEVERDSAELITARSKWSYLRNEDFLGQRYKEYARVPPRRSHSKVTWDNIKEIQEIRYFGHKRTYEKRSERSRPNPWRRYGAVLKLHEIGGWVSKIDRQQSTRRNRKYYYVRPGSKPCNPPNRPPITVRDSKVIPASAISIPQCESIEQVASAVGLQLQMLMRINSQEKLTPPLNIGIHSASNPTTSTQNNTGGMDESNRNSTTNNNMHNKLPLKSTDDTAQQMSDCEIQMERVER
uniref:Uncharacterized protein n=1 Tax=Ascaris lumbricoides TaxID=6252 RepID=A0A0M3IAM2_ASCLU